MPLPERLDRWSARLADVARRDPGRCAEAAVSFVVVVLGTALVIATLDWQLLTLNTTPTGGDMGAHVWGPAYLRDELLPNFRLSGWTHDWYDGFPAYQFYMVIPSLLIVLLDVGLPGWAFALVALAAVGAVVAAWAVRPLYRFRRPILVAAVVVTVLSLSLPYNVSFKLISAVGLIAMPIACWAFAKLADLPFPIPPIASAAGLIFLYNREPLYNNTGNIIGGNFHSTMAGEFAFSISLTLSILYLASPYAGLRTGRYRALAAALFALAGLCHLIPAFFVLACTFALFVLHADRARLRWMATMVPVAGLLTAFWVLPFWWRRDYVNDMGWERLPIPNANASGAAQRITGDQQSVLYYLFPNGLKYLFVAAAVGVVISAVRRYRIGLVLGFAWFAVALAFWLMPQYRLWNARLLPFQYLSVSLLAAIAAGELLRLAEMVASGGPDRRFRPITVPAATVVALGTLLYVAMPVQDVAEGAFGDRRACERGRDRTRARHPRHDQRRGPGDHRDRQRDAVPRVRHLAVLDAGQQQRERLGGLELQGARAEAADVHGHAGHVHPGLARVPRLHGDDGPDRRRPAVRVRPGVLGVRQRPHQLLRHADGADAAAVLDRRVHRVPGGPLLSRPATVPFHFLMQSELSAKPSTPQRELPYPAFDIDAGVQHLQPWVSAATSP